METCSRTWKHERGHWKHGQDMEIWSVSVTARVLKCVCHCCGCECESVCVGVSRCVSGCAIVPYVCSVGCVFSLFEKGESPGTKLFWGQ